MKKTIKGWAVGHRKGFKGEPSLHIIYVTRIEAVRHIKGQANICGSTVIPVTVTVIKRRKP